MLSAGRNGRTLVVLTSDHGESLGDHGEATHGVFAYEATLKVPLVFYQPRLLRPVVVDAASTTRRYPADHSRCARAEPSRLVCRDEVCCLDIGRRERSRQSAARRTSRRCRRHSNRRWAPLHGVIQGWTSSTSTFRFPSCTILSSDPREEHNLAASQPARVEELRSLLGPLRGPPRDCRSAQPETAETRERLRSLGYLAGDRQQPDSALHGS